MPRFVVLEHVWKGTHWDFLLEAGPVLRSWALDEPIVEDRLLDARGLPDHRALYLDYEGPISGDRGVVRRWDWGTYEARTWEDDRIVVQLMGTECVGVVELRRRCRSASGGPSSAGGWTFRLGKVD